MKVLKFGGTSLADAGVILSVKDIVEARPADTIVVVSAFGGVTNQLLQAVSLAVSRNEAYKKEIAELKARHEKIIREVINKSRVDAVLSEVKKLLKELEDILGGVFLLRDISLKSLDYLLSFGERISAFVLSEVIPDSYYLDSRQFICTDSCFGNARVDMKTTESLIKTKFSDRNQYTICPGFIASNEKGESTTLGRGGSDYTASIIASCLQATGLEIWTDVDGFMTADPKKVKEAYAVDSLTYPEAMELSHFGAKVVYTPTILPVYQKNIPVWIKNTLNPSAQGTLISTSKDSKTKTLIKGISSIDHVVLLTMQGPGMAGVSGVSARLFSALARVEVNIVLITQASSEYSITFAIAPNEQEKAKAIIELEFVSEMSRGDIRLLSEEDLSIIAIVGDQMKNKPGISANLFRSLGINGINVVAIAQGSSERNVSVVVHHNDLKKSLNVIHEGFFLSETKELHLYICGLGGVGKQLISQLANQKNELEKQHRLKINLMGVARSKKMLVDPRGIDFNFCESDLERKGEPTSIPEFISKITTLNLRNSIFIDCTADEEVANMYQDVLDQYVSVVTANKIACSSAYKVYANLIKTARENGVRFMYETNVGAGLPIIKTFDDLTNSGDKIIRIEAVLSGTMNYIFNIAGPGVTLSDAIKKAKELGFSEPDPRVDLSGIDVARKILILARQAGYHLELDDVKVQPFLPDTCFKGSLDDFWKQLEALNDVFEKERQEIAKDGKKWRLVALLSEGRTEVKRVAVDQEHPAYYLEGSNNIILITTERYKNDPMVIKGYGAGADVTAAGVFGDIIRVANI